MVVPSGVLRVDSEGLYVWVCEGDILVRKGVTIGYDDGNLAEVKSGLDTSSQVVTSAPGGLNVGMKVLPKPVN